MMMPGQSVGFSSLVNHWHRPRQLLRLSSEDLPMESHESLAGNLQVFQLPGPRPPEHSDSESD